MGVRNREHEKNSCSETEKDEHIISSSSLTEVDELCNDLALEELPRCWARTRPCSKSTDIVRNSSQPLLNWRRSAPSNGYNDFCRMLLR